MPQVDIFGPVDALLGAGTGVADVLVIEALLFVLVLANLATRALAHRRHVSQAGEGAEAVTRFLPHEAANVLLLLGSFYYATVAYHGGMVMSALVVGLFITDFFEFESRKVEARRDLDLERPKGALFAATLVLFYASYQTLFFLVEGYFQAIV
jgi:hypothetical protein